jgi:8-oxo-dGTP diphosphatase
MTSKSNSPQHTTEREFLANYDASAFPHPSVAVDIAIVTAHAGELRALLVKRDEHPAKDAWALPGGFVGVHESLDDAASRLLREKGEIQTLPFLEQLYTFGAPQRDPRTRVISVAYYALVHPDLLPRSNGSVTLAALSVPWKGELGGPVTAVHPDGAPLALAFDHADMLGLVVKRLRGKLDYAPIGFELLPKSFTLRTLQEVHETILNRAFNKDSFRRRMLASGRIRATGKQEQDVDHRPAALYRFVRPRTN